MKKPGPGKFAAPCLGGLQFSANFCTVCKLLHSKNPLLHLTTDPIKANNSQPILDLLWQSAFSFERQMLVDPLGQFKNQILEGTVNARTLTILLVCACLLLVTQLLWGQNVVRTHGPRHYYDPQTRTLVALPQADVAATDEPATTTFTGTLVFNLTITVKANIASGAKIQCTATASLLDVGTSNEIIEQDTVLATRTGTTATCSPTIPYSWNLASSSSDKVSLGFIISAPSEATGTSVLPSRVSEQLSFASISIPVNGATTTETLTPTF